MTPSNYTHALMTHARALDGGLIARICCDDTRFWCEVADPMIGKWIAVS